MWEEATRGPGGGSRALPGPRHRCGFGGTMADHQKEGTKVPWPRPSQTSQPWSARGIVKKFSFSREWPEQPKQTGLFVGHKALSRAEFSDGPDFGYCFCVSRLWLKALHKILPYFDGRSLFNCILAVYKIRHVGWVLSCRVSSGNDPPHGRFFRTASASAHLR